MCVKETVMRVKKAAMCAKDATIYAKNTAMCAKDAAVCAKDAAMCARVRSRTPKTWQDVASVGVKAAPPADF